ncbi:NADH dehydrogenase [ubiquinone] 1 beta subcomplex subunit 8, mitochondrial [Apis mellifera carnica]|uniref:NADH dehydrogenase [ubiquinone] 1 beta subcomplex subunit 8, mitochondrial n=1 Tax=Apis mellifera TaxID=7460 RepID=A0A7M7RA52_APIME|nr:NADH dehydrogenase [ubiquinone] 1 beta subcomplex subunit 8, mitochondrial [Apis mellifera]KAG9436554.1 NADH dehydrogenase [ubiquinone] 1 beta subcomplex subunit 8, mitochondrial [Apis mellifera carnica]|eukprot:XP_624052.1 NADH dehydrogenase [ubiquinone] 1 beta subcomplex subunit 8, mitochondrial [Apis mellifera]
MAALKTTVNLSKKLFVRNITLTSFARKYDKIVDTPYEEILQNELSVSQKKYMPGLYPKTKEEMKAAAEKYGLHPDEYKPCDPDTNYAGDYPDLPFISVEAKDPYYPWDFPALRRNFEEPIHKEANMLFGDRYEYGVRQIVEPSKGIAIFCSIMAACILIFWLSCNISQPLMEKQYPGKGIHYTFELK